MTDEITLPALLQTHVQAEVARRIDRPRSFVHRLRWGAPLWDDTLIEPLADIVRVDVDVLRRIVTKSRLRARRARRSKGVA